MKTFFVTTVLVFLAGLSVFAQRFAYVDSEYILKHIPDYVSAEKELDALSAQWQKEVDTRLTEIEKMTKAYQGDQPLLTDEMRKRRESEIAEKERGVKEFQGAKFGVGGELFEQQKKLIRPIQDKVAKAVQFVAERDQLSVINDIASSKPLYLDPRYDKSNDVIQRLGYKPGTFAE